MSELLDQVTTVLRDVFGDDDIVVSETTSAEDVEGWDSLMHLNLVIALEKRFGIRFSTAEISLMKEEGQNLGTIINMIKAKKGTSA